MNYLIDKTELEFDTPAQAVLYAMNNKHSLVEHTEPVSYITDDTTNYLTECRHKGMSVQIDTVVLSDLLSFKEADWILVMSLLGHVTLVTKG